MKPQLRQALAKHLGRTLTPEICAQIEIEALATPDQSIDPYPFLPVAHGGYVIQVESFRAILAELEPLHAEHWLETEKHRHGLILNPDYDALFARERAGRLVQFTARKGGQLAGHLRMFLGNSLHTQTLFADEDTLFIRPQHRGTFLVMALMRYAEAVLLQLGAREIRANSKAVNRADVLMRRLGYQLVAYQFVKLFQEIHHEPAA